MSVSVEVQTYQGTVDLEKRWSELDFKKGSLKSLCEEYARWTLPYLFPPTNAESVELQLNKDSIGAQAVNHLSNKVVSTLFPPQRNFFRLHVGAEVKEKIEAALAAAGSESAGEDLQKALVGVEEQLLQSEKKAQEYMDMVAYRPTAVETAKLLIVTGNALLFRPEGKPTQVFNLRDFCVVRDLSGEVIEIMTKETKSFETFHPDIQVQLKSVARVKNKPYGAKDDVNIYTQIKLEDDGRFHVYQQGDKVELDTDGMWFVKDDLPWIVLTWNYVRGEDYGRGLVADYSGAFHAVNVLSGSLLNLAAILGDIKFLVNPASMVDVHALNNSPPGSYHSGKEGDVTAIQTNKNSDAAYIGNLIERYERQISQAFLLNSGLTRDAERVTAEEIRAQANELEMSNGGIYSRLAAQWQIPEANLILKYTEFEGLDYGIVPQIVTGMDSLSRLGELDNIRLFLADLAMLNSIPEDVRQAMDIPAFASVLGTNRQVEYKKFMKTSAQMQAEQEAAIAQQQQLQNNEANNEAKVAASKEAVKGE